MPRYDLEERTFQFAKSIRNFVAKVPRTISNMESCKQLVRSSGSVAANYIEANESFSSSDFIYRIKICRKEAKESVLWLRLLNQNLSSQLQLEAEANRREARELLLIFSSIINGKNSVD